MIHYKQLTLLGTVAVVGLALTYSWFQGPKHTTQAFVGHLHGERYEEAALMLRAPSTLEVTPDGGLILVDESGRSTAVPAAKLPFVVGGHDGALDHDFSMTALGSSTNGVLDSPAVTLYLSVDGGEVSIQGVGV